VLATVANGLSGSLRVSSVNESAHSLSAGATLRRGDQVESTGAGELRWLRGGTVRLRPGARLTIVSDTDIRLTAGTIFVDLAVAHQAVALRVLTPFATVEHVGTQFVVSVDERALDVGVRQGAVRVIGAGTTPLSAGDGLRVGGDGVVQQRRLAVDDPVWHWTGEPLFAFDPEGRSVLDLLQWVSQEKGRPLEFVTDALRQQASSTVLHGSIRGLTVDESMDLMLATTSLQAAVMDDRIDVASSAAAVTTLHR
jgi:ferric-dicitrate binding protein FerR (iron transport regulator)